jgi:hypothetical protein
MASVFLATTATLIWTPASTQPVEFIREHVSVLVGDESIFVVGTYLLRNPAPRNRIQPLSYPFPVDSTHLFPDSISVTYRQQPVEYTVGEDWITFSVELPAGDQAGFRVTYRQACLDNSACYILTSTSVWGTPLQSADFVISLADDLVLDWISYEVDEDKNRAHTYTFDRDDFGPDRDLCLRWRRKKTTGTSP